MAERKLKTLTLGCKVNQYETELVREGLLRGGFQDAADTDQAELCVVNTCTVTNEGDAKSRQAIRKLAKHNPDSKIVVMGCYATRAPDELVQLPNVVEVVTDKREIPDLLGRMGVIDVPDGISQFGDRHRAYVKVQDGCLLRCSFCIIPYVRPEMYSREESSIVSEVRRLAQNGFREIVLTGIHLGHYGVDFNRQKPKEQWVRLAGLMEKLAQIDEDFRIRLSSIEATEVTRELIEVMGRYPEKICPHLHISMQSGSDSVLRRMRRRWGSQRFVDRCQMLKDALDRPAISTDIIVGFPGETETEFEETCQVSEKVGFSKIHIFPFSPRKGTPAATMDNQIPGDIKADRRLRLAEVEDRARADYYKSLVGMRLDMLAEGTDRQAPNTVVGTSCRYAPVRVPAGRVAIGERYRLNIESADEHGLVGAVD